MQTMTSFRALCQNYINFADETSYYDIIRQLMPDSEFLAFKYWYMVENPTLYSKFKTHLNRIN